MLAISCLCLVIVVIAVSSLNVAIPSLLRDIEPTPTQLLWIVDSYALVFAGCLLTAGAIGDRFGRKGALLVGLTIFGLGSIAASQVHSPSVLIAMRAIMGLGASLVMPATLSTVTSVFPTQERPKAIATWAGFAGAGGALGPVLGGLVVERWGWDAVFFINVPIVVVAMVLISLRVPTSRDEHQRSLDMPGAVLSVLALASLLFGVIEGPEKGWASATVLGAFAVAAVLGALFVVRELRTAEPMLDPRLFAISGFRAGSMVVTTIFFGMFGMFFMVSQYLQFVKGFSALTAGLATLPSAVTMIIVTPRSPRIVAKLGTRKSTTIGLCLVGTGFAWFSTLGTNSPYLYVALGLVIVAAGMGMSMAPASTAIVTSLPQSKAGVASAVNDVTREVGGAFGIAVLGTILGARYTAHMSSRIPDQMPAALRKAAESSINAADAIADQIPAEFAKPLRAAAREAFTSGMNSAFVVSSAALFVMAIIASRTVPESAPPESAGTPHSQPIGA